MTGAARGGAAYVLFARAEWRARWRSHLLLAGIAALAVAGVVAPLTAAARSEGAFTRLRAATHATDAVADNVPGAARNRIDAIRALDGVDGAAVGSEVFVRPQGSELFPDYDLYPLVSLDPAASVNHPVITHGRAARPDRPDEVVFSEVLASRLGLGVGDATTLESMTPKWIDAAFNGCAPGPPDGPRIPVRIVGLARSPADFGRLKGVLYLTPAFLARYRDRILVYDHVEMRLAPGASRAVIESGIHSLGKDTEVGPSAFADDAATDDALTTTATALRLIAAAAALAGAIVFVFAVVRATRVALGAARTLAALGWTTRQLSAASLLAFAPAFGAGIVGGALAGIALAPRVMLGLARRVDPTPGAISIDAVAVVATAAVALVLALAAVVLTARRSTRDETRRRAGRPARLTVRRPLPMTLGFRHALRADADAGGRATRGALIVLTAGVASIVAALAISASIARLQNDPSLSGRMTAGVIDSGESVDMYDRALPLLAADREIALLAGLHVTFGVSSGADHELTALTYDVRRGRLPMSVVHGRIATGLNEVALGPATLDALHKRIGDQVELRGRRGVHTYSIVGSVLFPEGDFSHDDGVALTTRAAVPVIGDARRQAALHQIAYAWNSGTDARAADRHLVAEGLCPLNSADRITPASVTNLGHVEALPRYLGYLVLLMALATVAQAMSTNVKRRSKELSILRALGMRRRLARGVIMGQALCILVIALLVGVPLGLVLGRRVWLPIANGARVVVVTVEPAWWIAGAILATVIVTLTLALGASWRATRVKPRDALRAE
jgi:hypothetical protein